MRAELLLEKGYTANSDARDPSSVRSVRSVRNLKSAYRARLLATVGSLTPHRRNGRPRGRPRCSPAATHALGDENYRSLREELQAEGVVFLSDTDTEVIPHLVGRQLAQLVAAGGAAAHPAGD